MEKELVEFLVRSLVDRPEEVSVNVRTILSACATKDGKRASLEILD